MRIAASIGQIDNHNSLTQSVTHSNGGSPNGSPNGDNSIVLVVRDSPNVNGK